MTGKVGIDGRLLEVDDAVGVRPPFQLAGEQQPVYVGSVQPELASDLRAAKTNARDFTHDHSLPVVVLEKLAKLRPQLRGEQPNRPPDLSRLGHLKPSGFHHVQREKHYRDLVARQVYLLGKLSNRAVGHGGAEYAFLVRRCGMRRQPREQH